VPEGIGLPITCQVTPVVGRGNSTLIFRAGQGGAYDHKKNKAQHADNKR